MSHVEPMSRVEQQLQEDNQNIENIKNMIAGFKDLNGNMDMDLKLSEAYYYGYKIGHENGYKSALNGMLDLWYLDFFVCLNHCIFISLEEE